MIEVNECILMSSIIINNFVVFVECCGSNLFCEYRKSINFTMDTNVSIYHSTNR